MRETLRPRVLGLLGLFLFLSSCATYNAYYSGLFEGKRYLDRGQYDKALAQFRAAAGDYRDEESLAFLATAFYKTGDFQGALANADAALMVQPRGFYALRALGYRSLALFRFGKPDAWIALENYLGFYRLNYPLTSIEQIEVMMENRRIELPRLEGLIDEQVGWYEKEIEQFLNTRTGFYDRSFSGDHFY